MSDPTPMDRLRELELTPDLPRAELWEVIAGAVQEIQERLVTLEELAQASRQRTGPRHRRERS